MPNPLFKRAWSHCYSECVKALVLLQQGDYCLKTFYLFIIYELSLS